MLMSEYMARNALWSCAFNENTFLRSKNQVQRDGRTFRIVLQLNIIVFVAREFMLLVCILFSVFSPLHFTCSGRTRSLSVQKWLRFASRGNLGLAHELPSETQYKKS